MVHHFARRLELSIAPNRVAKRPFRTRRAGIKRLVAITVAIGAAIAIMYGESWAIERAPASEVACAFAKTADLKRALDNVPAGLTGASSADAL
jgi:hypothetical protein